MDNGKLLSKYFILFLFFFIFCFSNISWAATYYVSPNGSNTNPGTIRKPFKSLSFVANKKVRPGDSVIALDGTYYDSDQGKNEAMLYIRKGGTSDKKIVFKAQHPGKAVLDGRNIVEYGIFSSSGVNYLTIEGFEIKKCRLFGIRVNGRQILITKNIIHNNGNTYDPNSDYGAGGIYTSEKASYITIDGNKIYNNGRLSLSKGQKHSNLDHGIYLCSPNSTIINNLIYGNQSYGIQIAGYKSADHVVISNNTIFNEQNRGGIITWLTGAKSCIIQNNILFKNNGYAISFYKDGGRHTARNNIFFKNKHDEILQFMTSDNNICKNKEKEPLLNNSYVPTAISPAINAGCLDDAPDHDIDGNPRTNKNAVDIGCYEYINRALSSPKNIRIAQ